MGETLEALESSKFRVRPKHIAIVVVVAATVGILGAFGIISFFAVPGVSAFYIAIGFYTAFAVWFGGWGVVGVTIGTSLGAIFAGTPIPIALAANIPGSIIQAGLPAAAVRWLGMDPRLKSRRDWIIFVLVCNLLTVVIPGSMFMATLAAFGIMPWKVAFTAGITSYIVGDVIVIFLITAPLLKGLSNYVMRTQFYMEGWWE